MPIHIHSWSTFHNIIVTYHKSSQTPLECKFIDVPSTNNYQIPGVPFATCAVNDLCIPVIVDPDEMGDGVNHIDTMLN